MANGQLITGKKAQSLVSKGAVLVDVRDPVAFRDGTLPNAVNMSLRQLSQLQKYPKTTAVVVFGDKNDPATLNSALNYLTLYGFTNTFSLGTTDQWYK
jgi:rhodanese-related sulfurtransferase